MDRTVLNHYRLFIRTLEKTSTNRICRILLQRLQAAWSADNMPAILDHLEEGMEKTGWTPHMPSSDPSIFAALVEWMETCNRLPPPPPPLSRPPSTHTPTPLVSGIVEMANMFHLSPEALTRVQHDAHAFERFLENPTIGYAESRALWG